MLYAFSTQKGRHCLISRKILLSKDFTDFSEKYCAISSVVMKLLQMISPNDAAEKVIGALPFSWYI